MPEHEEQEVITLVDEEGNEHDAEIFSILEVDGKNYAILKPVQADEEEGEETEVYVLRIDHDGEGEILVDIDDDEWEKVQEALMEEEFDEDA